MSLCQVDLVVHGNSVVYADPEGRDPYAMPKKKGKASPNSCVEFFVKALHKFFHDAINTTSLC